MQTLQGWRVLFCFVLFFNLIAFQGPGFLELLQSMTLAWGSSISSKISPTFPPISNHPPCRNNQIKLGGVGAVGKAHPPTPPSCRYKFVIFKSHDKEEQLTAINPLKLTRRKRPQNLGNFEIDLHRTQFPLGPQCHASHCGAHPLPEG